MHASKGESSKHVPLVQDIDGLILNRLASAEDGGVYSWDTSAATLGIGIPRVEGWSGLEVNIQ